MNSSRKFQGYDPSNVKLSVIQIQNLWFAAQRVSFDSVILFVYELLDVGCPKTEHVIGVWVHVG
jgi:hypothetical protein